MQSIPAEKTSPYDFESQRCRFRVKLAVGDPIEVVRQIIQ